MWGRYRVGGATEGDLRWQGAPPPADTGLRTQVREGVTFAAAKRVMVRYVCGCPKGQRKGQRRGYRDGVTMAPYVCQRGADQPAFGAGA